MHISAFVGLSDKGTKTIVRLYGESYSHVPAHDGQAYYDCLQMIACINKRQRSWDFLDMEAWGL